jgi:hypothetical protein
MEEKALRALHRMSSHHSDMVEASQTCGCFYCGLLFKPSEIKAWTDDGTTALCPGCCIDSVLPNEPTAEVLQQMKDFWFKPAVLPST